MRKGHVQVEQAVSQEYWGRQQYVDRLKVQTGKEHEEIGHLS
jgi:hypothetical protein